uniref:Uncharacterized protein n=1 Tax=Chenopodium quinoa TaxID=63459 RepID=A0A803LQW9_CHEQI
MQIRKLLRKLPHTPSPEPGVGGSGTSTQVPETQDGSESRWSASTAPEVFLKTHFKEVPGKGKVAANKRAQQISKGSQSYNPSIASQLEEHVQAEVVERIEEAKVQMQAQMEAQFATQLHEALKKEREEAAIESKRMMETMLQNLFSNCSGGPPFQFRREDDPDMSGGGLGHQTPVS